MIGRHRTLVARIATVALVAALWLTPPPEGLTVQAWRLFAIFAARSSPSSSTRCRF